MTNFPRDTSLLSQIDALSRRVGILERRVAVKPQEGTALVPPVSVGSGAATTLVVNFPTPFETTPIVMVTLNSTNGGAQWFTARADMVTLTSFRIVIYNVSTATTTTTGNTSVSWTATAG